MIDEKEQQAMQFKWSVSEQDLMTQQFFLRRER